MSLLVGAASNVASGFSIDDSLRFRRSATAYLQRTPATTGNRKIMTFSWWMKLGTPLAANITNSIFSAGAPGSNPAFNIGFNDGNNVGGSIPFQLSILDTTAPVNIGLSSNMLFRDYSAWYHCVVAIDTSQSTSGNRVKLYVNGTQQTLGANTTYGSPVEPSLNFDVNYNTNSYPTYIGKQSYSTTGNFDGYLTEVNFVDGTALAPTDFGETDNNGTWIPKKYTGSYGTNGFYLPMKPTTQATGFNTVLYAGNNGTQAITGVGFTPDFVWIKQRTDTSSNVLSDTVRGAGKSLLSNSTVAEDTNNIYGYLSAFNSNGFTVTTGTSNAGRTNETSDNYVAWCWNAGGSTVTNGDGTISAQVRANSSTGFSIATYTGNGGTATFGHGLGAEPKMVIIKNRSQADGWYVWHTSNSAGVYGYLFLNDSDQLRSSTPQFGSTLPSSSLISLTFNTNDWANASGEDYVAYSFADISGYQKLGSYTGNGSATGPTITTGFRPAFLMIKRADSSGTWAIWDATRNVNNPRDKYLHPDLSDAEPSDADIDFNDNGFQLKTSFGSRNASGGTYLYLAIAETRNKKYNFDASGNKNNWTPNNINSNASGDSTYDLMSDVPTLTDTDTANFATLNAVDPLGVTPTNGNLTTAYTSVNSSPKSTIAVKTGKWYMEWTAQGSGGGGGDFLIQTVGVISPTNATNSLFSSPAVGYYSYGDGSNGNKYVNNVGSTYGAFWGAAGTYNVAAALDLDGGTITFYLNGASQGAITLPSSPDGWVFANTYGTNSGSSTVNHNFGQRPFAYTIPTGFKKLNTFNLPDSTIEDGSEYFDTALYTGSGSAQSITGTEFSPDFVWIKNRSHNGGDPYYGVHLLFDSIRGVGNRVMSSSTDAEAFSAQSLTSFTSDGFNVGTDNSVSYSGDAFVGWQWDTEDTTAVTYTVKVVSDGGNKYRFDDYGTSAVTLNLHETGTYTFDQSDSSNSGHPLRFSATSDGTHGGGSEYTTGVTVTGTPGSAGAKTVIVVAASAPTLYYYCTVHSGMGGQANTNVTKGSSNFSGSIISTVSANTTAGFSIVTYTEPSSGTFTVGHGLGVVPSVIILKCLSVGGENGVVFHKSLGAAPTNTGVYLNSTSGAFSAGANWLTENTTTRFGVSVLVVTPSSADYVAYCFAEVEGYSKISKYTGNGSADGPFIYTGFRPSFVMIKRTDASNSWVILDDARNLFNQTNSPLFPDGNFAEETNANRNIDILSNGFKVRSTAFLNTSSGTYIYMAFAKNPFKNSNAR